MMKCIRNARTKTERRMVDLLYKRMSDDVDFINGIMVYLEDDDERQAMIDEIEDGNVETPSDAILYAIQLDEERETE